MSNDKYYMQKALELAERGAGFVNPNPLVGALLVKEGRIIGEGWHTHYGGAHAERAALKSCTESTESATMYVTLEPCCHYGKTPPCTEAIIESGITRVVAAMQDPNPRVAGKGFDQLRAAGIEVVVGIEEEFAREQNRVFLKYITTKKPWITLKCAMTLDGKIATHTGDSRWITGTESRIRVHEMRSRHTAILTGIGTLIADDPMLNVRLERQNLRQPIRVVADSSAQTPLDSQLVKTADSYRTIVAHTTSAKDNNLELLRRTGVETLLCKESSGVVDIDDLCLKLGEMKIDSLLLEGGGAINYNFLQAGVVDEVYAFIAPKIVGGVSAKTPVEGRGAELMSSAIELSSVEVERIDDDILITGRIKQSD